MKDFTEMTGEELLKEHEDRFQYLSDKLSIPSHNILCDLLEIERLLAREEEGLYGT